MRLLLLAATLTLWSETPRAAPARVTIEGTAVAVDSHGHVVHPEGGVWVWVVSASPAAPGAHLPVRRIVQQGTEFNPHVLVIPKGTVVEFPNKDPWAHNVFSPKPYFDLGLYNRDQKPVPRTQFDVPDDKDFEHQIYCDVHKCMWARIKVADVPGPEYIQQVSADGHYRFELPPGTYDVWAWAVASSAVSTHGGHAVAAGATWQAPALKVQTGNLDLKHRNKFNPPYGVGPNGPYPGRCP